MRTVNSRLTEGHEGGKPAGFDLAGGLPEPEAMRLAAASDLGESLQRLCGESPTGHLTLDELQVLAKRRRDDPAWAMPEHLSACPVCLDLFGALLDTASGPSPAALDRFVSLFPARDARLVLRPRWRMLMLKAAAAVLAAALGGFAYLHWTEQSPPSVATGRIERVDGRILTAGSAMPARERVAVREDSTVTLADGTSVDAAAGSVFAFKRGVAGGPVFDLDRGEVLVTAAKQPAGSSLAVRTPLGTIRVVGTVFRVTLASEAVVVHEARPGAAESTRYESSVGSVTVVVDEGVVSVGNRHETIRVPAGRAAVMRQGQQWIEFR